MAMATRTAMTVVSPIAAISSIIAIHRHGFDYLNPRCRWASSSSPASADYESTNRKTKKSNLTDRLSAVIDAANDRKLPPELRGQRNNVRSETDIVNIVEKRIWQSMEGHFENLPGKGKPLDLSTNPHAAPDEDTLYRILSQNGCAPEWVELNKQIRSEAAEWRSALKKAWTYKINGNVAKWTECSEALMVQMGSINNKFGFFGFWASCIILCATMKLYSCLVSNCCSIYLLLLVLDLYFVCGIYRYFVIT